jgi:hypothetical protein
MWYRLAADLLVISHLAWILFMLWGFTLTVRALWRPAFFERWLFRTIHLIGIGYVAALGLLGEYCPLTVWEYELRVRGGMAAGEPGSFIARAVEALVYWDVPSWLITIPTVAIAAFTLIMFVVRPPRKFRLSR